MGGLVIFLHPRGWGRIELIDGRRIFFAARHVDGRSFNGVRIGDRVNVGAIEPGERGPDPEARHVVRES